MLFRAVAQELQVSCRGLCVVGVRTTKTPAVGGDRGPGERDGREKRVGFEGWGRGVGGNERGVGGQGVAVDEDVVVGGAPAFGGDDVGEVGGGDFVDDADHGFGPGGVVVFRLGGGGEEGGLLGWGGGWGRGGCGGVPVGGVGETGLGVGYACEVEGHDQGGDGDVGLGEGADTAFAEEGLGGEVGAVGKVEDCARGAMGVGGGE